MRSSTAFDIGKDGGKREGEMEVFEDWREREREREKKGEREERERVRRSGERIKRGERKKWNIGCRLHFILIFLLSIFQFGSSNLNTSKFCYF